MEYIGEIAALSTAFFWAFTSIFFSESGKLIGAYLLNKIRLLMAVVLYACILLITTGTAIPSGISPEQYLWLGLSGVIGLALGDSSLFKALLLLGPRLTTLIFSCSPILTAIVAWVFLDERLSLLNILGILITVSGIIWVVIEKNGKNNNAPHDRKTLIKGGLYALGGAVGQALGLILAKQGMVYSGTQIQPFMASYTRLLFALSAIWIFSAAAGHLPKVFKAMKNKRAMLLSSGGTIAGPFLGVWFSLVAIKYIETGIAATLNALVPIMIIPLVIIYYKEQVSRRSIFGALLAVIGVSLLMIF